MWHQINLEGKTLKGQNLDSVWIGGKGREGKERILMKKKRNNNKGNLSSSILFGLRTEHNTLVIFYP